MVARSVETDLEECDQKDVAVAEGCVVEDSVPVHRVGLPGGEDQTEGERQLGDQAVATN